MVLLAPQRAVVAEARSSYTITTLLWWQSLEVGEGKRLVRAAWTRHSLPSPEMAVARTEDWLEHRLPGRREANNLKTGMAGAADLSDRVVMVV